VELDQTVYALDSTTLDLCSVVEDSRQTGLPASICVSGMSYWNSNGHGVGSAPALSGTFPVTKSMVFGLSLRLWPFQYSAEWQHSEYDKSYRYSISLPSTT